jgi:hypothetical protein
MIDFDSLWNADLIVDQIYEGGSAGNAGDDPISKLLGTGNQGGFRVRGTGATKKFVVLYTSGENNDWPDHLNLAKGAFVYFGDNKTSGSELHNKAGNKILRDIFGTLHGATSNRGAIYPFFVFEKHRTQFSKRSVKFIGLAVPGYAGITSASDLVAIWKTTGNDRFQNYKATFTILNEPVIKREWINKLIHSDEQYPAPKCWEKWQATGLYQPLITEPTRVERSPRMQLPNNDSDWKILRTVWTYFSDHPYDFEYFAAAIFSMQDNRAIIDEVTQGTVDGGRDAIGRFRLGIDDDPIYAEFSLEAKCYRPPFGDAKGNSIGVKETSRLISRIRNRQFGVLVTTSYVGKQAYSEIRRDGHPIVFIAGGDIVKILKDNDLKSPDSVLVFLKSSFDLL